MSLLLADPIAFSGGICLPNPTVPIVRSDIQICPIPKHLIYPLRQHIGNSARSIVSIGEHIFKGQVIAETVNHISASIHAGSSGTVVDICDHSVPNPSGKLERCIIIETDGQDEWFSDLTTVQDYRILTARQIYHHISDAGIVGLGGAGFPSANKMLPGLYAEIELLILNAVECEPYIHCDKVMLDTHPEKVIIGFDMLSQAVQVEESVIAIEEGEEDTCCRLKTIIDAYGFDIKIINVPKIYPAGGERQLIKSLTGIEITGSALPMNHNILVYNLGTAVATYDALAEGRPLISRVVTFTGGAACAPGNLSVLLGTPIIDFIDYAGGLREELAQQFIVGGAMMGFVLNDTQAPIIKTTNCILAVAADEFPSFSEPRPCINCGDCVSVCPERLMPNWLFAAANMQDYGRLKRDRLFDCIECGCCAYVCPSQIPLVEHYRQAKSEIWDARKQQYAADKMRLRHEAALIRKEKKSTCVEKNTNKKKIKGNILDAVSRTKNRRGNQNQ